MKTNFEELNNQKLYRKTYWASGRIEDPIERKLICQNRDKIWIEFGLLKDITKSAPLIKMPESSWFDHLEFYRKSHGRVFLVTSPYKDKDSEVDPKLLELGFVEYDPIYNMRCRTFYVIFDNIRYFKKVFKDYLL